MAAKVGLWASILGADLLHLGAAVEQLAGAGVDGLHLDIMDGAFVADIAFGAAWARALTAATPLPVAAHLMARRPRPQLARLATSGCQPVIFHLEAEEAPSAALADLARRGVAGGVALSPGTPPEAVAWLGAELAVVLVMTSEPGAGGQGARPELFAKVSRLAALRAREKLRFRIAADGGIDVDSARALVAAGADDLVVGHALTGAPCLKRAVADLKEAATRA